MKIRPIRSLDDLRQAKGSLADLIRKNLAGANNDDIEVLSALIESYERARFRIQAPTPVAAIKFRMQQMGLSPRQLEPYIGSRARVSEVLSGKRSLSIDMIRSLHEGLGIPYESLISTQNRSLEEPLDVPGPAVAELNKLGFEVDVGDVPAFVRTSLQPSTSVALLRKTRSQRAASKTDQSALLLWQAAILQSASNIVLKPFTPSCVTEQELRRLAKLSSKPTGPVSAVQRLAELGIAVVFLPQLPGTFLDGAVLLGAQGSPVIGLTLRHDRIDNFWFTLLHEVAHVCRHYEILLKESTFIDDMDIDSEDVCEREADELARTSLIPDQVLAQVHWSPLSSADDLVTVASRARVHLSVVAGRWQRDHQNYRKFARLIERDRLRPTFLQKHFHR